MQTASLYASYPFLYRAGVTARPPPEHVATVVVVAVVAVVVTVAVAVALRGWHVLPATPPAGARPVAGCCNRPGSVASSQHHGGSMSDYLARLEVATCQPPLIPCQCRTIDSPAFDFRIRSPQPCLYRESRGDFSLQLYIVHRLWLSTHARQSDRTSSYMLLTPSNALSVCIAQPFHATNVELSVLHSMSRRVLVQPA